MFLPKTNNNNIKKKLHKQSWIYVRDEKFKVQYNIQQYLKLKLETKN